MHRRTVLAALVALGPSLLWPHRAWSQKKPKGGGKGKENKDKDKDAEIQLDGKVKQVSPQGLVVEAEDGTNYLIGIAPNSQVTLQGRATKGFLVSGAFVEFEVNLDRSGTATSDVASLTFVDVSPLNPAGLFPTSLPEAGGAKEKDDKAGGSSYLVRGKIVAPRNGMFTVQAGGKTISAKATADIALQARFSNWSLAAASDQVKGKAEQLPQANTGLTRVVAKKLNIHASQAIEPAKSK